MSLKLITALSFMVSLCTTSEITPELTVAGKPYVLAIFDFHKETDTDGNCQSLKPKTIDAVMALKWANDFFNRNNQSNMGLLMYDSCGDMKRALTIIGQHVNGGNCQSSIQIAGVVTLVKNEIQTAIVDVLKPFGILHTGVSLQDYVTSASGSSLAVAGVSMWKIQDLISLAEEFQWKYFNAYATDDPLSKSELNLFRKMAQTNELCVKVFSDFTASMQNGNSDVLVIFATGYSNLDDIISKSSINTNKTVVIIGDSNIDSISTNSTNNTLFMREHVPKINDLYNFMEREFTIINGSETSLISKFLTSFDFCEYDSAFNHTVCNNGIMQYWESSMTDRIFPNILSAYHNMFRVLSQKDVLGCTGFDFSKCMQAVDFVSFNLDQSGFPVHIQRLVNDMAIEEQLPVVLSRGPDPSVEVARIQDKAVIYSRGDFSSDSFPPSMCGGSCSCEECTSGDPVPNINMISKDGDIILTAGFPVFADSALGVKCGDLSSRGVSMVQSFLYAVDTVKDKYPSKNLLPGVSIGYVIHDTCTEDIVDVMKFETSKCYPESLNQAKKLSVAGKLVSGLQMDNRNSMDNELVANDLATFRLSPNGLSISPDSYGDYINVLSSVLRSLDWTYISVVYSSRLHLNENVKSSVSSMRKSGICLSDEIVLNTNIGGIETETETIINATAKSGSVVFMTTNDDTDKIFKYLITKQFKFDNVNFVFFPWNYLYNPPKGSIVIRPQPLSNPSLKHELETISVKSNGYYRGHINESYNNWWVKYHELRHKCHVTLDENVIYPSSCTSVPTLSRNDFSESINSLIVTYVDTVVSLMDKLYKEKCPLQTAMCDQFKTSDIINYIKINLPNYSFEDGNSRTKFSADGNLKLTIEILNRQITNEVMVGGVSTSNELTLQKNLVFAYDSLDKPIRMLHQCSNWCPSCQQCNTNVKQNADYNYMPGDVDIVGMIPLYSKSQTTGVCDVISLKHGPEYIAEAFLYAIKTSTSRYPYLLPGISIGSLLVDTCSNVDTAQQSLSNFETCFASFSSASGKMASPSSVPSYFLYANAASEDLKESVQRYGKFAISHFTDFRHQTTVLGRLQNSYDMTENLALTNFLSQMEWSYVSIVVSEAIEYTYKLRLFSEYARQRNICIESTHTLTSGSVASVSEAVRVSPANVVVLFLSVNDIRSFFAQKVLQKVHIIGDTDVIWDATTTNVQIPFGSIVMNRNHKVDNLMKTYLDAAVVSKTSQYNNKWLQSFLSVRENCPFGLDCNLPHDLMIQASKVVMETDVILHGLHNRIIRICGASVGLCKQLETAGLVLEDEDFKHLNISTHQETIILDESKPTNGVFEISNFQGSMIQVGEWRDDTLTLAKEQIRAYSSNGVPLSYLPLSKCLGTCICTNINNTSEEPEQEQAVLDPERVYFSSMAKFQNKLWVIVVLAVACGGVAASLLFIVYVIYKTCKGLLNKRYIGLGILLLLSITALYLSVLPFLFTPSETSCAARYLLPSITYAFVYGTCLTKLMSLRSYKLIGLGGEISNLNQFLTVVFTSGVQISISVQYVSLRGPFLEDNSLMNSESLYSCKFDREQFVLYLIYDMFLVLVCSLYALTVRKEKKNMGEALFILISSWINIFLWIAWVAVTMTISRDNVEMTICIGILACATVIMATVFVPKLHKISKLKYDVKKSGVQNGGYKIDTDFMFERPHTLPGGFRNSYNMSPTPRKTNPKSLSTFDSSLSY